MDSHDSSSTPSWTTYGRTRLSMPLCREPRESRLLGANTRLSPKEVVYRDFVVGRPAVAVWRELHGDFVAVEGEARAAVLLVQEAQDVVTPRTKVVCPFGCRLKRQVLLRPGAVLVVDVGAETRPLWGRVIAQQHLLADGRRERELSQKIARRAVRSEAAEAVDETIVRPEARLGPDPLPGREDVLLGAGRACRRTERLAGRDRSAARRRREGREGPEEGVTDRVRVFKIAFEQGTARLEPAWPCPDLNRVLEAVEEMFPATAAQMLLVHPHRASVPESVYILETREGHHQVLVMDNDRDRTRAERVDEPLGRVRCGPAGAWVNTSWISL